MCKSIGLVVKWISHVSSEHGFGVRVPTRPPFNYYGKRLIIDN